MRPARRDHALSRGERAGPQRPPAAELPHRTSAEAEAPAVAEAAWQARALLPSERGLLRAHAGLSRARLCRRGGVAELFQVRLRPQPLGPAGVGGSLQKQIETRAPARLAAHARPPPPPPPPPRPRPRRSRA